MSATYHELLLDTRRRLEQAGVSGAQIEARFIVCHACGKTRDELVRDAQLHVTAEKMAAVDELVGRRLSDEPLAYILGEWEFMGRTIEVTRDTLIPRSDTEILCEQAIDALGEGGRLLDLCCGSGCVGLCAIAEVKNATAVLCDLVKPTLAVARRNARKLGLSARALFVGEDALLPLPEALGRFDVIVSNPPYIPHGDLESLDRSVRGYEPMAALDGGDDGLDFYRAFARNLKRCLNDGGRAMFEVGAGQARAVADIFARAGWTVDEIVRDLAGIERVVKCGLD